MTHADTIVRAWADDNTLNDIAEWIAEAKATGFGAGATYRAACEIADILEREGHLDKFCHTCWIVKTHCECEPEATEGGRE